MANIVSRVRTILGMSQADIAAAIGVHRTTVLRWENEETTIDRPAILALEGLISTRRKAAKQ